MAGNVSWSDFVRCLTQLLKFSDLLSDGWTLHGSKDIPGDAYIVKKIIVPDSQQKAESSDIAPLEEPLEGDLEDASVLEEAGVQMITWEYHVVYSQSYSVPVLYFNAWGNDGRLLSIDDIWSRVHERFQDSLQQDRWNVLTQQEHPKLRRPFYILHPCRTAEFLELLQERSPNIVLSWLSTVGPAVGLELNPQYAQLMSSQ